MFVFTTPTSYSPPANNIPWRKLVVWVPLGILSWAVILAPILWAMG